MDIRKYITCNISKFLGVVWYAKIYFDDCYNAILHDAIYTIRQLNYVCHLGLWKHYNIFFNYPLYYWLVHWIDMAIEDWCSTWTRMVVSIKTKELNSHLVDILCPFPFCQNSYLQVTQKRENILILHLVLAITISTSPRLDRANAMVSISVAMINEGNGKGLIVRISLLLKSVSHIALLTT